MIKLIIKCPKCNKPLIYLPEITTGIKKGIEFKREIYHCKNIQCVIFELPITICNDNNFGRYNRR